MMLPRRPALVAIALTLFACGGEPTPPPVPTSVVLSPATLSFDALDASELVTATVRDQNGAVMAGAAVSWSSSASSVATVAAGTVTSVSDGDATITATAGAATASIPVSVAQLPTAITADPSPVYLVGPTGDEAEITATLVDGEGSPVEGATFTWMSEDPSIASVTDEGRVAAVSLGETGVVVAAEKNAVTIVDTIAVGVYPPLVLDSTTIPNAVSGEAFAHLIGASGGNGTYQWAVTAGDLAPGLSLDAANGSLGGTPTLDGQYDFTVQVTSGDGQVVSSDLTGHVYPLLQITTDSMQDGLFGVEYTVTTSPVVAFGGDGNLTWSVASGALPDGLVLGPTDGEVTGTPTATGQFDFTVEVTSGDGQMASVMLSMEIFPSLVVTTTSLPNGTVGDNSYLVPLEADAPPGVTVTWSIAVGMLPDGLQLLGTSIEGTPTTPGTSDFTVQATGSDGQIATRELSITIVP